MPQLRLIARSSFFIILNIHFQKIAKSGGKVGSHTQAKLLRQFLWSKAQGGRDDCNLGEGFSVRHGIGKSSSRYITTAHSGGRRTLFTHSIRRLVSHIGFRELKMGCLCTLEAYIGSLWESNIFLPCLGRQGYCVQIQAQQLKGFWPLGNK